MSWEIFFGAGVVLLGLSLAYGLIQNARRHKANDSITEEATRKLRENPDQYQHGGRDRIKGRLKGS
jgi:hypothetical protein